MIFFIRNFFQFELQIWKCFTSHPLLCLDVKVYPLKVFQMTNGSDWKEREKSLLLIKSLSLKSFNNLSTSFPSQLPSELHEIFTSLFWKKVAKISTSFRVNWFVRNVSWKSSSLSLPLATLTAGWLSVEKRFQTKFRRRQKTDVFEGQNVS